MEADEGAGTAALKKPGAWRDWANVAIVAALLLLLSQALWLWQTWPVRELLDPPAVAQ